MTAEPYYKYFIRSQWHRRVETPAAIGAKFLSTLDALSRIDPIFKDWILSDFPNPSSGDPNIDGWNMKTIPIAAARPRIAEIVENYVIRNDFHEPYPDDGYHATALTSEIDHPGSACLRVRAGGKYEGHACLEFGDDPAPDLTIVTYPLYKAAVLAINAAWRAPWACAEAFRSGTISVPDVEIAPGLVATKIEGVTQVPLDRTFPKSIFHIPWIAYLSAEHAAGVAPDARHPHRAHARRRAFDERHYRPAQPNNSEHVRRARIIAEVMVARFDASSGKSRSVEARQ